MAGATIKSVRNATSDAPRPKCPFGRQSDTNRTQQIQTLRTGHTVGHGASVRTRVSMDAVFGHPRGNDIVMPATPDLQALVDQYGGYHRIPNEAWAKHNNQMATAWVWLAMRHIPKESRKPGKRAPTARKRTHAVGVMRRGNGNRSKNGRFGSRQQFGARSAR